jgi:trimeric autotransporter adhesin
MALSSSSLENVTQLSDKNAMTNNYNPNETNSPSSFSTKSNFVDEENFIQLKSLTMKSKANSTLSSSSSSNESAASSPKSSETNDQMSNQKEHKKPFNLSLFDSSASHSSLPSPLDTSEPLSKIFTSKNSKNNKMIEYGALIFDSLLTNNLTDFTSSSNQTTAQNLTNSMQQTPNLFKNEQEKLNSLSKSNNATMLNNSQNNNYNKKWFDILASSASSTEKSLMSLTAASSSSSSSQATLHSISNSNIKYHSNTNLDDPNESSLNSLTQYSFSDQSVVGKKSEINNAASVSSFEKTLPLYRSPTPLAIKNQASKNESKINEGDVNSNNQTQVSNKTCNTSSGVGVDSVSSNSTNAASSKNFNANNNNNNNNNNNGSGGLFDRFLKNYNSSSSVMDEPELSFVSYHTNSNPSSPNTYSNKTTCFSRKTDESSSFQNRTRNNMSMVSSGCASVSLSKRKNYFLRFQKKISKIPNSIRFA